jgi:hypothetical protein
MTDSLRDRTRRLLIERPRHLTYQIIAAETALKPAWLEAFAQDKIPDPGVGKVEKLFDFLNGKSLQDILNECAA